MLVYKAETGSRKRSLRFLEDPREAGSTENSWYFSFVATFIVLVLFEYYYYHQEKLHLPSQRVQVTD